MATDIAAVNTTRGLRKVGRYSLLVFVAVVVLFPIYAVLLQALKSGPDSLDHPRSLLPVDLTFSTISEAWTQGDLGRLLMNSLFVSVMVTLGVIVTSLLAAYAFAFLEFPFKGPIFVFYIATMLVPGEVTVVFNQRTADSLGWINSYQGLIVPSLASTFGVFLVRQVFLQLPHELPRSRLARWCWPPPLPVGGRRPAQSPHAGSAGFVHLPRYLERLPVAVAGDPW